MNELHLEKSPYLQQHKDNPVWWKTWSPKAFDRARQENKPVFISIGYSTCHWCHVMERECFEDKEVADYLNTHFISIKVDREERPDVDSLFMSVAQAMSGQGGWPLSAFVTSDGKPFFAGTYFPKKDFLNLLEKIWDLWTNKQAQIQNSANEMTEHMAHLFPQGEGGLEWEKDILNDFVPIYESQFDWTYGGRQSQMKFPDPYNLRLLLRIGTERSLEMTEFSLEQMARGGIYDHLGGGFCRYATDPKWLVPHFEKMLYDQASLSLTYVEASRVFHRQEFELVAREIYDYVLRDLRHPEGGFYSAEDADSEGIEGKFYLWTEEEIRSLVTEIEFRELKRDFDITSSGNFENRTIILKLEEKASREKRSERLSQTLSKLLEARKKRIRPLRDEKILTSWNSLMISSLARGAQLLEEPRYEKAAIEAMNFLLKNLQEKGNILCRRWMNGEQKYPACLEDYAYFVDALIEIYQINFDEKWILLARRYQDKLDQLFWDHELQNYYFSDGTDENLFARTKEVMDNVLPSGNSMAAWNLIRLSEVFLDEDSRQRSKAILKSIPKSWRTIPQAFPQLLFVHQHLLSHPTQTAIVTRDWSKTMKEILAYRKSHPFYESFAVIKEEEESKLPLLADKSKPFDPQTIYRCHWGVCQNPEKSLLP